MSNMVYGDSTEGYQAIEKELQKRREKRASVKGSDCQFRVEFRYPKGTKHWQYFTTYEDAIASEDSMCRYSVWGNAIVERPTSKQIQVRGKRGGWSKYRPAESEAA